jgi:hypothetical protein
MDYEEDCQLGNAENCQENVLCAQVGVHMPSDPVLAAWKGASEFGVSPEYSQQAITKAHYDEVGYERLLNISPEAVKNAGPVYYTTSG